MCNSMFQTIFLREILHLCARDESIRIYIFSESSTFYKIN